MAKNKTQETEASVVDFIHAFVDNERKKADSFRLLALMESWTGVAGKMWGPSIIGFGSYHYKYASGHEGDAPLIAFSPRKAALTLYVFTKSDENLKLLENFGKFKMTKGCIYVKKLDDINLEILEKFCHSTIAYLNEHHECSCRK